MKYIISENGLERVVRKYLNNFIEDKVVERDDATSNINIRDKDSDEYGDFREWMEFEFEKNRLWVEEVMFIDFSNFFGFEDKMARKEFGKWFGNKFRVHVDRVRLTS